jgi:hypothetical protein
MASSAIGLAMLSAVVGAGVVFLLWVLYHLLLDNGQFAAHRKHMLRDVPSGTERKDLTPKHERLE